MEREAAGGQDITLLSRLTSKLLPFLLSSVQKLIKKKMKTLDARFRPLAKILQSMCAHMYACVCVSKRDNN